MIDWKTEINTELSRAEQARADGKEGRARVCARRAAGIAARVFLEHHGRIRRTPSAYDLLRLIYDDDDLPSELRRMAAELLIPVDQEFKLPDDIDLVQTAKKFCITLLKIEL